MCFLQLTDILISPHVYLPFLHLHLFSLSFHSEPVSCCLNLARQLLHAPCLFLARQIGEPFSCESVSIWSRILAFVRAHECVSKLQITAPAIRCNLRLIDKFARLKNVLLWLLAKKKTPYWFQCNVCMFIPHLGESILLKNCAALNSKRQIYHISVMLLHSSACRCYSHTVYVGGPELILQPSLTD